MLRPSLLPLRLHHFAVALIAALTASAQPLDPDFNPAASADVFTVAAQPDEKILLGGNFTSLGSTSRSRIARLNVDGSVDTSFNPGADRNVNAIVVQPDRRILVAGGFSVIGGAARSRLARLNPDGTVDPSFAPVADATVLAMHLQPDGRILIGGIFTSINGTPRISVARLNADGSLDPAFKPALAATVTSQLRVDAFVTQSDGKFVIGGSFSHVDGVSRPVLARFHSDGSLDPTFALATGATQVLALALQPDGRLLVGGNFNRLGNVSRQNLARLDPAGVPDNQVGLVGPNTSVQSIVVQHDGKFVVGGTFSTVATTSRSFLARFNADGTFDPAFTAEASGNAGISTPGIYDMISPAPGQLVFAGVFAHAGGAPRTNIARLGGAAPTIVVQPRSGTYATGQPIVLTTSAHGSDLSYQWQRNGTPLAGATAATLTIPAASPALHAGSYSAIVRNTFGSALTDSATVIVEARTVYIARPPENRTLSAGDDLTLRADAGGSGSLTYQWFKDGVALPGATSSTLALGFALPEHAGAYTYSVTDPTGTLVSSAARITVTGEVPYLVTTLAGQLGLAGFNDGPADTARLSTPNHLAVDAAGYIYVAAREAHVIRKISPGGAITTLAGQSGASGFADGPGDLARFSLPVGIAVDPTGNIFVADSNNHRIRKITPAGIVSTIAGGTAGALDGRGAAARFSQPTGLALDSAGNLYVTEVGNHTVRKISPAGDVTLLAGLSGVRGHADGQGVAARFARPSDIVVDPAGNLYVADTDNHVIRHITAAGLVTTYAGQPGVSDTRNGAIVTARFTSPQHLALDASGHLFVASPYTVRRISPAGEVTTPLGAANAPEFLNGLGSTARFSLIGGLATDSLGALYISDSTNALVRKAALLGRRDARLANLSVRTLAGAGNDTLIVGFNLAGGTKSLLVRAIGPSLSPFGVTGVLANPTLQLDSSGATLAQNDDWHAASSVTPETLALASARVGAFALPAASRDAALLSLLTGGSYTAQVGGGSGIALVEVYDADPHTSDPRPQPSVARLANVSARTRAGTGNDALIVGFVITGDAPRTILLRAVGPTLASFGVTGALTNPRLELTRGTLPVAANTGWAGSSALAAAFAQVGAFPLPADSRDAALLVTLLPGAYTAQVTPASGAGGIALVEIYDVP